MPSQPIFRTGAYVSGGRGIPAGSRRHIPKLKKDNIRAITQPSIRRLARRGGVKRIKYDIYDATRDALKARIKAILERIILTINCAGPGRGSEKLNGRKTITTIDVVYALKEMGTPLYGFDWPDYGRPPSKKKLKARL